MADKINGDIDAAVLSWTESDHRWWSNWHAEPRVTFSQIVAVLNLVWFLHEDILRLSCYFFVALADIAGK